MRGRLYDFVAYPGAVLEPSVTTEVHGTVLVLPDDPDVVAAIDAYEGFDPEHPDGSLFVRTTVEATMSDGRRLTCLVYVYNRDPSTGRLVTDGRHVAASRSR